MDLSPLPACRAMNTSHDHVAWGHHSLSMATVLAFHAIVWSISWDIIFQHMKAVVGCLQRALGSSGSPELSLGYPPGDSHPCPHLANISVGLLCFVAPAQMFYIERNSQSKPHQSGKDRAKRLLARRPCHWRAVACVCGHRRWTDASPTVMKKW